MKELEGKSVVVVGASHGLGKTLVEETDKRGARVYAMSRSIYSTKLPLSVETIRCDATKSELVAYSFREVARHEEKIDVVICSLGLGLIKEFAETTDKEIEDMINTDLVAPILVARQAFKHMKSNGGGHIVTISSTTGLEGKANEVVYSAAKQGVRGMNQALAKEGKEYGIEATCVFPGGMKSDNFWSYAKPDLDISAFMDPHDVAVKITDMIASKDHPLELVLPRE